jgi:SAM-dependent methyltransferase
MIQSNPHHDPPQRCGQATRRLDYFQDLYRQPDPYGSHSRWYERRKRRVLLSALPRQNFRNAYEPACGTGELSQELSLRCAHVLASDFCEEALAQARASLRRFVNVKVERHELPAQWPKPDQVFDLIVVSEVCSFLEIEDVKAVARSCAGSLDNDGVLVLCDWRWPFDARVSTAELAHEIFNATGLHRLVRHEEKDFLLGVWSVKPLSVAQRDGIA